jgi:hypothetical protein
MAHSDYFYQLQRCIHQTIKIVKKWNENKTKKDNKAKIDNQNKITNRPEKLQKNLANFTTQ